MNHLLKSTALASVLALALPAGALALDQTKQGAAGTSAESSVPVETGTTASASSSISADGELMAQIERLRMLDTIGNVEIVKVSEAEAAEFSSEGGAGFEANAQSSSIGASEDMGQTTDQPTASAGFDTSAQPDDLSTESSEELATSEPAAGADEMAATEEADPFAPTGDLSPEGSQELAASEPAAGSDQADAMEEESAQAGASFEEQTDASAGVPQRGEEAPLHTEGLSGEASADERVETAFDVAGEGAGKAGASDELSASFVEDSLSQIPEVRAALEENGATAADVLRIDIQENGDVTIYVREA
jgi:hypothetical protein